MAIVKIAAPWVEYYEQVNALFAPDPNVHVVYEEETKTVKVYAENNDTAAALAELLPEEKTFGNVTLKVVVVPPNSDIIETANMDFEWLIKHAFLSNPLFSRCLTAEMGFGLVITYALFHADIVQYYNDSLNEFMGYKTTTCAELAKTVLDRLTDAFVFISSEVETNEHLNTAEPSWP